MNRILRNVLRPRTKVFKWRAALGITALDIIMLSVIVLGCFMLNVASKLIVLIVVGPFRLFDETTKLPSILILRPRFDVEENLWSQITIPPGAPKPPPMAGHSATVHGDRMIVFGGLQKQRSSIGQFSSSNDVWIFNVKSKKAMKCNS
jgi:hypothetical protein